MAFIAGFIMGVVVSIYIRRYIIIKLKNQLAIDERLLKELRQEKIAIHKKYDPDYGKRYIPSPLNTGDAVTRDVQKNKAIYAQNCMEVMSKLNKQL